MEEERKQRRRRRGVRFRVGWKADEEWNDIGLSHLALFLKREVDVKREMENVFKIQKIVFASIKNLFASTPFTHPLKNLKFIYLP